MGLVACDSTCKNLVAAGGTVTSMFLFVSPFPAIFAIRKSGVLGAFNPLPLTLLILNSVGWVVYGYLTRDYWVSVPNSIGWVSSMICLTQIYGLLPRKDADFNATLLIVGTFLVCNIAGVSLISLDPAVAKNVLGVMTNIILIGFYGSPLSVIVNVIKTKNSAALNYPIACTSVANSALWTMYGIVLGDYFIFIPNGLGVIFGITQLILLCIFPKKSPPLPQTRFEEVAPLSNSTEMLTAS